MTPPALGDPEVVISREPAAPDNVIDTIDLWGDQRIDSAIDGLISRQASWSLSPAARANALGAWATAIESEAEAFSNLMAREVGKPIREARGEVARAVAILRYYAQAAFDPVTDGYPSADGSGEVRVQRRPHGTILAITPWNFPIAIPVWKVAPALAYGNTAVLRPSGASLATAMRLAETATRALPPGVLEVIPSSTQQAERLVDDSRFDAVSFTGSSAVGSGIVRRVAARNAPVQAEMGGQNPAIVLADADLERAASAIVEASMAFAGQKCTATSRVIVVREVAKAFTECLVERCQALVIGDPVADSTIVGPVISESARRQVISTVEGAVSRGGRVVAGGRTLDRDGWFVEPTIVALDNPRDAMAQTETFGPVASLHVVQDDMAAIHLANSTAFGLAAAVYGRDIQRATKVAERVTAGMLRVNAPTTGVEFYAPFGGERASSYGPREQGRAARDFYTKTRTMLINLT